MVFSSDKKIKISKDLYSQLEQVSQEAGYSSVDEFINHVLQREVKSVQKSDDQAEAERQLRGLGYIE